MEILKVPCRICIAVEFRRLLAVQVRDLYKWVEIFSEVNPLQFHELLMDNFSKYFQNIFIWVKESVHDLKYRLDIQNAIQFWLLIRNGIFQLTVRLPDKRSFKEPRKVFFAPFRPYPILFSPSKLLMFLEVPWGFAVIWIF